MKKIVLMLLLFSSSGFGSEIIRLEGISIQGNSEEPNMLYVTPWQSAPGAGQLVTPIKKYRDHWLKPTSKSLMKRETTYLNHFKQKDIYSPAGYENK